MYAALRVALRGEREQKIETLPTGHLSGNRHLAVVYLTS